MGDINAAEIKIHEYSNTMKAIIDNMKPELDQLKTDCLAALTPGDCDPLPPGSDVSDPVSFTGTPQLTEQHNMLNDTTALNASRVSELVSEPSNF